MAISAKELKEQRAEVAAEMKKLHDSSEGEDRGFTPEEDEKWNGYRSKIEAYDKRIETAEYAESVQETRFSDTDENDRFDELRKSREGSGRRVEDNGPTRADVGKGLRRFLLEPSASYDSTSPQALDDLKSAQRCGFNSGSNTINLRMDRGVSASGQRFQAPKTQREAMEQAKARMETRDQTVGTTTEGGHLVPDSMMQALEMAQLKFGGMRSVASVISTDSGSSMPFPTVNDTTNSGKWLAEATAAAEEAIVFGQTTLGAHKGTSDLIYVSLELLQDSATNMDQLIGNIIGERKGRLENTAYTVGDGSGKPTGVVGGAANSGITTASTTAVTYEEMVDIMYSVDIAYRGTSTWMMHDTLTKYIVKLKDSEGRPLWLPSISVGEPDTILNHPYVVNNDMGTATTDKAILFGDFSHYKIRDVMSLSIMRLVERYAELGQVAFIAFYRTDGKLIDAGTNPIKYGTLV